MRKRTFLRTKSKFIVNESNKMVICIMQCNLNNFKLNDLNIYPIDVLPLNDSTNFTVKAFAKCSPEDVFSEKIGKRIAESKAKKEAFIKSRDLYIELFKSYSRVNEALNNLINNCEFAAEREYNRLRNEEYLNDKKE